MPDPGDTPISETATGILFRRPDGTTFEVPRGVFGGLGNPMAAGQPPNPTTPAPTSGIGGLPGLSPPGPIASPSSSPSPTGIPGVYGAGMGGPMPPGAGPRPAAPRPPPVATSAQNMASYSTAIGAQGQAIKAANEAKAQGMEAEAAAVKPALEKAEAASAVSQQDIEKIHQDAAARTADLDIQAKKWADMKVDPGKAFGEGATGVFTRIAALIGMGLSGITQTRRGGPNIAAEMIRQTIQQSVEAQIQNIANGRASIADQRSAIAQDIKNGMDLADVRTKYIAAGIDRAKEMAKTEGAKYSSEATRQEANNQVAGLAAVRAKELEENRQKNVGLGLQAQQTAIVGGHLALAKQGQIFSQDMATKEFEYKIKKDAADLRAKGLEAEAKALEEQKVNAVHGLVDPTDPSKPYVAPDPKRASAANAFIGQVNSAASDLKDLIVVQQQLRQLGELGITADLIKKTPFLAPLGKLGRSAADVAALKTKYEVLRKKVAEAHIGGQKVEAEGETPGIEIPVLGKLSIPPIGGDPREEGRAYELLLEGLRGDAATTVDSTLGYKGPLLFKYERDKMAAEQAADVAETQRQAKVAAQAGSYEQNLPEWQRKLMGLP